MSEVDAQSVLCDKCASGYLSEAHKRKFTITAGILGAAFFIAQFLIPFVIVLAFVPLTMLSLKRARPERGAYWDNAIWYLEGDRGLGWTNDGRVTLEKIDVGGKKPKTVCSSRVRDAWLLAGNDRLWIIGSDGVDSYQAGRLTNVSMSARRLQTSRPFLYHGRPAVVERQAEGFSLTVFTEDGWQKDRSIDLDMQKTPGDIRRNLQVLSDDGKLHFFLRYGGLLYYAVEQADAAEQTPHPWQAISQAGDELQNLSSEDWQSLLIDGKPAVFYVTSGGSQRQILGARLSQGRWDTFFSHDLAIIEEMGVYSLATSDRFAVLVGSFSGPVRLLVAQGDEVVTEKSYGGDFPFSRGFQLAIYLPQLVTFCMPLLLALILSVLMRKYRQCVYKSEYLAVPFASLARRAGAQIIDSLCLSGFIIAGYFLLVLMPPLDVSKASFLSLRFPFAGIALIIGGVFWAVMCLLLFSYLEGTWGVTPGKWVLGIRVLGTDLQPCGFGRGLIRNLLKFVDGFFNFMVGVLIAALTENWQRVGDMAARTVVVDVRSNAGELPGSLSRHTEPRQRA